MLSITFNRCWMHSYLHVQLLYMRFKQPTTKTIQFKSKWHFYSKSYLLNNFNILNVSCLVTVSIHFVLIHLSIWFLHFNLKNLLRELFVCSFLRSFVPSFFIHLPHRPLKMGKQIILLFVIPPEKCYSMYVCVLAFVFYSHILVFLYSVSVSLAFVLFLGISLWTRRLISNFQTITLQIFIRNYNFRFQCSGRAEILAVYEMFFARVYKKQKILLSSIFFFCILLSSFCPR